MLHTNFEVDRTNGCLVIAIYMFFLSYSAPKWQSCALFLFDQRLSSYTCVPSLVMISHFVQELYFKQHLANVSIDANWRTVSQKSKFLLFLIIIDIQCPESISAVVWF